MQTTESQSLHMGHRVSVRSGNPYWIGDLSHESGDLYENFFAAVDAIHLDIVSKASPDGLVAGWEGMVYDYLHSLPKERESYLSCIFATRRLLFRLNCMLDGCPNIIHPYSRRVELFLEKTRAVLRVLANSLMLMDELDFHKLKRISHLLGIWSFDERNLKALDMMEKAEAEKEFRETFRDEEESYEDEY